jgi:hypothetical protein
MKARDAFDLFWEWANKAAESPLTIDARIHHAVMNMPPEDRRDRTKVNAAVEGLPGPANDHASFLLSSEIIAQNAEPLIGEMTLTTDQGDLVLAINRETTEALIEELTTFLDTE